MHAILLRIFDELVPPPARLYVWRFVILCAFSLHVAWACGAFAALGMAGFALTTDVVSLREKLDTIEAKQNLGLRISLAADICRLYVAKEEVFGLDRIYEERQDDYKTVNLNVPYDTTQCTQQQR
jgi:hypothetical protein